MAFSITVNGLPAVLERLAALDQGGHLFGGVSAIVTPGALNYAEYVSTGTRPHDIYPRNKRVLAWPGAGTPRRATGRARAGTPSSGMVFAMHVHHPGTRPNPYVEEAVAAATEGVVLRVTEAVTAIIAGNGGAALLGKALEASGLVIQSEIMHRAPVKTGTLRRAWHVQTS
jgi:hypothetical protein